MKAKSLFTRNKDVSSQDKTAGRAGNVFVTNNYKLFSPFEGNRPTNQFHIKRLEKSLGENHLPVPIVVDETYRIGDGQNRYEACMNLGLPIYYIVIPELTLEDVQLLNANVRPWDMDDYMDSYCDVGKNPDYHTYRGFKMLYNFSHSICLIILTHGSNDKFVRNEFKDGILKITDIAYARECAEKITAVRVYYSGYSRRSFVYAMLKCFKNPEYDHELFIEKLSKQSAKFTDQPGVNDYMRLIEEIYNFRTYEQNRVRLY